ncbi:MAG: hypothetical protein PHI27_06190 [Eubacteriales bacterium]|nr:hypothetical protein [Eubacteriales bacterium]MDD3881823.1 hypothetical protein [Eubacteriales bacterium]MDD4512931.1 hypothetical protein [Eubacteriales bacterium]
MIQQIVQSNFAGTITVLMLLVFTFVDRSFNTRVRRLFLSAIMLTLALIANEIVEYIFSMRAEPSVARYITTAMGYTLRMCVIYTVCLLTRRREQHTNFIYAIPIAATSVICFLSIENHWCFHYTETNEFVRGNLGYLPFYVSGLYMLLMMIWTYKEFRKNGFAEAAIILMLCIIIAVSTFLESACHYVFILNGAIAASLVFCYLYLHVRIYMRDALTNLLNRR